ncbi:hypothetical protein GQ43DRAFT_364266 [Delitschia confertaspora ATCC 74209]|uniref:Transcription factor domain-containing protein n=1 Tax=Delitschia confertaspora ATCC 74209 TaxID=1513339 RepID=A0A9P4JUI2_9PLEO|nr:hypothetical protein GQ43DRAFT_364266 [Delitschia confertaspora ATCC 74209]
MSNYVPKARQSSSQQATGLPLKQDFLFVDSSTKSAKSSRQGRRNARSFVMQKARRERPWSTSKHAANRRSPDTSSFSSSGTPEKSYTPFTGTPSPPQTLLDNRYIPLPDEPGFSPNKHNLCQDCQIFLCRPGQRLCPRCSLLQPPAPPGDIDGALIDPFGTFAVEVDSHVSELLDHFISEMMPGTIAVDIRHKSDLMRSDWFGTAMGNSSFMHSLLCTVALHRYIMGRESFSSILYHKAQAIAAINATISDPNLGISDANIGAVFNLMCVEEALTLPMLQEEKSLEEDDQSNPRMTHLQGLRTMVRLRGGLQNINSNRCLQAFIFWHSTVHAIASFEAPPISTIDYIHASSFPRHPRGYQPAYSHHLLSHCRISGIQPSLITLVESVLVLMADLNACFGDPQSPLDPFEIQNFSYVLESLLLHWLQENSHSGLAKPLEDALCVALLIFTVRTTEALDRRYQNHHLHFVASKRLQKALCATNRHEWLPSPDLLLWILSIGSISADGSPDRLWFIYQTSLACAEFGIESEASLLARLHQCGWVSFKLDEAATELWEGITKIRLEDHTFLLSSPFNGWSEDDQTLPTVPVGPLQYQVSSPDFSDWLSMETMGMGAHSAPQRHQQSWNVPTFPVGPLQFQVPELNFSDWLNVESLGTGGQGFGQEPSGGGESSNAPTTTYVGHFLLTTQSFRKMVSADGR